MTPYNDTEPQKRQVERMFNLIAPRYDMLNRLLSLRQDRRWRRRLTALAAERKPANIIDVASGTGDVAIALAKALPQARVLGIDLSRQMLNEAERKCRAEGLDRRIRFAAGDAERIAADDVSFDLLTVAFGVRNFERRGAAFDEFYRVLRHNGAAIILEFSTPKGEIFARLYRYYRKRIIPFVGGIFSDGEAYRYLAESIADFSEHARLRDELRAAGFADIESYRLSRGIATIYLCKKS